MPNFSIKLKNGTYKEVDTIEFRSSKPFIWVDPSFTYLLDDKEKKKLEKVCHRIGDDLYISWNKYTEKLSKWSTIYTFSDYVRNVLGVHSGYCEYEFSHMDYLIEKIFRKLPYPKSGICIKDIIQRCGWGYCCEDCDGDYETYQASRLYYYLDDILTNYKIKHIDD